MILTKQVEMKWTPVTISLYRSKGYNYTKLWDTFIINVKDLVYNSNVKIEVECDYCGSTKEIKYFAYVSNEYFKNEQKYACLVCSGRMRRTLSYDFIKNMVENIGI